MWRPSYEPISNRAALTAWLVDRHGSMPYALLSVGGFHPASNIGRAIEREVFESFFGNDAARMAEEYGPYESASHFLIVIDTESGQPAGVMRLLRWTTARFKAINDLVRPDLLQQMGIDPLQTVEIATIAVTEAHRGKLVVSGLLYRAIYHYSLKYGIDHLLAIIDSKPLELLHLIGLPIRLAGVPTPFEYLGATGNSLIDISIPDVELSVSLKDPSMFADIFGDGELSRLCRMTTL